MQYLLIVYLKVIVTLQKLSTSELIFPDFFLCIYALMDIF